MFILGALTALAAAAPAAPQSVEPAVTVVSENDRCCRLIINLPDDEVPCLMEQIRLLEPKDLENAEALRKLLSEKAEACRKPR